MKFEHGGRHGSMQASCPTRLYIVHTPGPVPQNMTPSPTHTSMLSPSTTKSAMSSPLPLPAGAGADLNAHMSEPHHDSEEYLNQGKHGGAQELDDLRTRASQHNSISREACPSRRASQASATADSLTSGSGARNSRQQRRTPRWFDKIAKFWQSNVSVTVEAGAQRDHLGPSITKGRTDLYI